MESSLNVFKVKSRKGNECADDLISSREPLLFKSVDIGACRETWSRPNCFVDKRLFGEVSVHKTRAKVMTFYPHKNFTYVKQPFYLAMRMIFDFEQNVKHAEDYEDSGQKWYFRSIALESQKEAANIQKDFPELWSDIRLPGCIPKERIHSTVLRATSADLQTWLHYDMLDNILIQVCGAKTVFLFPPSDAEYLYLEGDKSVIADPFLPHVDFSRYPLMQHAHMFTAKLEPGDCIFIPALWFHATRAVHASIGINAFWYHLNKEMYDPKDVYGNKDFVPAAKANQHLDRCLRCLNVNIKTAYFCYYDRMDLEQAEKMAALERLVKTLQEKLCESEVMQSAGSGDKASQHFERCCKALKELPKDYEDFYLRKILLELRHSLTATKLDSS